jgi:hypothetical protein
VERFDDIALMLKPKQASSSMVLLICRRYEVCADVVAVLTAQANGSHNSSTFYVICMLQFFSYIIHSLDSLQGT